MNELSTETRPLDGRLLLACLAIAVGCALLVIVLLSERRAAPAPAPVAVVKPVEPPALPAPSRASAPERAPVELPTTAIILAASGLVFAVLAYASATNGARGAALLWGVISALQWAMALWTVRGGSRR